MIVATPRPSSPSRRAGAPRNSTSEDGSERVPSLSFRRWNSIPGAALEHEAREARGRLGEHEEDVARRIGAEPLVAGELEPAVADRLGARGVGAHVRAALLLGHRHPAQRAGDQPRLPLGGDLGVDAQRGHRRVGHRDRAHHARVGVRPQRTRARRGRRARPAAGRAHGSAWISRATRAVEQPVPARDRARPASTRWPKRSWVTRRGSLRSARRPWACASAEAGDDARLAHALDRPAAALALQRLAQRRRPARAGRRPRTGRTG